MNRGIEIGRWKLEDGVHRVGGWDFSVFHFPFPHPTARAHQR